MSITYSLGGVALDDPDGRWRLIKGTLVGGGVTIRAVDAQIPGMDGSIPGGYEPRESPSFVAKMEIFGATYAAMMANLGGVSALLAPSEDVPLVRTVDDVVQSIVARGKSLTDPDFSAARKVLTVTGTLRLPGVYWRGASADWSRTAPASGTAYEVTTLAGSTAPVDDALYLITGPAQSPKVACGGGWAALNMTLAAGEKALIDCAAWTVRRGTGVTFAGGGTLVSGVLSTSGGPYVLRLVPGMRAADPVDTAVSVSLTAAGMTAASAVAVRARPAFVV